ncbi:MAG: glycosyltransferase [Crenarchaeota archaeon]|nr:glycosyltransferase [Thermoproteota archaeon]
MPSLQEAWGSVVTKALASGKPVIGSNVGGISVYHREDFVLY